MRTSHLVAAGVAGTLSGLSVASCATHAAIVARRNSHTSAATAAAPSGAPSESAAVSTSKQGPGVVYGQVVRRPGRDPRSGGASGAMVPVNGDPLEVHDRQGRTVANAVTKPGGTFRIVLAPGEYRIVEGICGVGQRVTVASGSATHLVLTISNTC